MATALNNLARRVLNQHGGFLHLPFRLLPAVQTRTILLAENDAAVREYMALVLHGMGYEVLRASSGPEALAIVRARRAAGIDLLITDLLMPAMGGKQLADRLWSLFPMQKVLFVSEYPERMARRLFNIEAEVVCLQKPFRSIDFARRVRELLAA